MDIVPRLHFNQLTLKHGDQKLAGNFNIILKAQPCILFRELEHVGRSYRYRVKYVCKAHWKSRRWLVFRGLLSITFEKNAFYLAMLSRSVKELY